MIPYQNFDVITSIIYIFGVKLINVVRFWYIMFSNNTLTSIPERNENEDECGQKWVPKKKHEVLKAKYKCLKKLFQLYDANVIGFIPDPNTQYNEDIKKRRRKRSHRTKTDAAMITEQTNKQSDKNINITHSDTSTQVEPESSNQSEKAKQSEQFESNKFYQPNFIPTHNFTIQKTQKLTRFQCFLHRLLGLKRSDYQRYALSDSYKRGLRVRRIRRYKNVRSETDLNSPEIMCCVQSVQKCCLMDNTPRQCPILGCKMMYYGIINYNDHLNLCHFSDRKYICHYCHEGFENEYDKIAHENEHIGLNKLSLNLYNTSKDSKIASITQTEPDTTRIQEEKLIKIVSFFDKYVKDSEKSCNKIQSESFVSEKSFNKNIKSESFDSECDKRTVSCVNIGRKKTNSSDLLQRYGNSKTSVAESVSCNHCGESFCNRRQLSLHVDIEHRIHNKFSKFHSCAAILNRQKRIDLISEDGHINIECNKSCTEVPSLTGTSYSEIYSKPSTNIVYSPSKTIDKKQSVVNSLVRKVRGYKWEPETKIIRV